MDGECRARKRHTKRLSRTDSLLIIGKSLVKQTTISAWELEVVVCLVVLVGDQYL
jgi:hypothetical protein